MSRKALVYALFTSLICASVWAQDNPVTNGSFEQPGPDGLPVDWQVMGNGRLVPEAHSGKAALLLDRLPDTKGETGLNRAWALDSGDRGAMLAELKGGLEFWYKAPQADADTKLRVYVIAVTATPLEATGAPRAAFTVPRAYIGDGQWHKGLLRYDFSDNSKARWVHVAARIEGSAGQLLLDDIKWLPRVGPIPTITRLKLTETPGKEGEAGTVAADVKNAGDMPMAGAELKLVLPAYLKAEGTLRQIAPIQPDDMHRIEWQVTGMRDRPDAITASLTSGDQTAEERLDLGAKLEVEQLRAERFVLGPGEQTSLDVFLRNTGTACARGIESDTAIGVEGGPPGHMIAPLPLMRPGVAKLHTGTVMSGPEGMSIRAEATVTMAGKEFGKASVERVGKASVEIICAARPKDLASPDKSPYAVVTDRGALVGNGNLRIAFARGKQGFGPAWLQMKTKGAWADLGVIARLAAVATAPASEGGRAPAATITDIRPFSDRVTGAQSLRITGTAAGLTFHWELSCKGGADTIAYSLSVTPDADTEVYGIEGPMLYAGEGAFGARKTEAIFPGLEWLAGEEQSSSTLDIAASMPQRWRWCPPPHAVTIPAMSVTNGDVTIGLLWDQLQKYSGDATRPRAVFASPDRFEGRNATLMGLLLPGGADPDYWTPPRKATEKPWRLKQGQAVTLRAQLYAKSGAKDALSALDRWFALYGAPAPQRLPHGQNWKDEIAFSALGYLDSLWDEKSQTWFQSLNGPNEMAGMGRHVPYLYDLVYASRLASDPAIRQRATERVAQVRKLTVQPPATDDDMSFEFGDPAAVVATRGNDLAQLMRDQGEDGAWRFSARIEKTGIFAGMDYSELGTDRVAEVGTCAQNAYRLLQFARMTGDPAYAAAGLKALAFMDRFTVPRAAQVWEVPVHTPDVLASADASEAYLEGYRITGEKRLLDKAVFWARTGLPFLYMWDTPGHEPLRYASIPVFGASWYTCNWFGQPVQWNGLRLARAYTRLAPLDKSLPWGKIAEGITISAMWQQHDARLGGAGALWPDTNTKYTGLWPDNFNSVDKVRCPWVFAPRAMLDNVYRFMGLHPEPETATAKQGEGTIRINACAGIEAPAWRADTLVTTLHFAPPQQSQVLVCNLAQPTEVRVNGKTLPEAPRLNAAEGAAWQFYPGQRMAVIRPPEGATAQLEIAGAKFAPGKIAPQVATKLRFHFDADDGGWLAVNDLTSPIVRDSCLYTMATGPDPYLIRQNLDLQPTSCTVIRIGMTIGLRTIGPAQLFWGTADSPGFDEAKSVKFEIFADGQPHEYALKVCDSQYWVGKRITSLRLDPCSGPRNAQICIDYVMGE